MWWIINFRDNTHKGFEDQDEALQYYDETCVDHEANSCWGAYIQRPADFFSK